MTFYEKVEAFLAEAESEGISGWNIAPPVYRFFWWLGIEVPPPSFLSRQYVIVLEGFFFLLVFFLFYFQFFSLGEAFLCAAGTGIVYGLLAGIQHLDLAYRVGRLPAWEIYIPGIHGWE